MTTTIDRPQPAVGRPVSRIDGPLKVTGASKYAADAPIDRPLFAVLVQSTISRGAIRTMDETKAREVPGVVDILTFRNAPRIATPRFDFGKHLAYIEEHLPPLQTNEIRYWGQHVAAVIASTPEAARFAATLLTIEYDIEAAETEVNEQTRAKMHRSDSFFGTLLNVDRGDADGGLARSATQVDVTYTTPEETHNAMEPSATVASWSGDELTVYDSTQWVKATQATLAHMFGIAVDRVRVISPFVGGGFGSKGFMWPHVIIAAMAAKLTSKSVKLVVDRTQFFTSNGHRSQTEQRIRAGVASDGKLVALVHDVIDTSGKAGDFFEPCNIVTGMLYAVPNLRLTHHTIKLDISTTTAMRAPGETPGSFALESAMDELAYAAGIDPVELRIQNHADADPSSGLPFSSKHLLECYREGAERFGWSKRTPLPRSMRDGGELVGLGMASATYPALNAPADVRARVEKAGRVVIETATHDLGTGMYTIIAQVASDALGIPMDRITVLLGDSRLPQAPVAGGSQSTASVMAPLMDACTQLRHLAGGDLDTAAPGLEATASSQGASDEEHYSFHSFGAQFCEVKYDEELARLRVTRFTSVMDCGRVLNAKTARSQIAGGIIMGLGMALMEETVRDPRSGAVVTNSLADYHVPVNADVPPIDVAFVEHPDLTFTALGARGIGEIGITGVAAAVANAVFHATGQRVRDLPIVPERLL